MFEMDDSKLGKLKVYNVTEARANFASVLREKDAKVVVTWHGRPFKVLVDYQEYSELLQKKLGTLVTETVASTPVASPSSKGQWSEEDLSQIVKSITENIPTYK